MTVFAEVDHQAAATQAGLTMQPATIIIFGTPKAGTPLMVKDAHFALRLPLKVLVTEVDGKVQVVMDRVGYAILGSQIQLESVVNTLGAAENLMRNVVR